MSISLKSLTLDGYLTFRELTRFEPSQINLLIGGNGAGKSNFISLFRMLAWMLAGDGQLATFVSTRGGASRLLHNGKEKTREIEVKIEIQTDQGVNDYRFILVHAAGDTLIFTNEEFRFSRHNFPEKADWISMGAGHRESQLIARAESGDQTAKTIRNLLLRLNVHQFHDTSRQARIRGKWQVSDGYWLKEDGANLGPFLLGLRESSEEPDNQAYSRIEKTTRLLAPFFSEFVLTPDNGHVLLQWRETGSDMIFDASQASDGMLRAISLVALLSQPLKRLPVVLIIDEPELGLHPYALNLVASLIKKAAIHTQVIVSTQSASLLDHFEPEDIVIVQRDGLESVMTRKTSEELSEWIEDYTLGELWRKNVLQGGP